MKNLLNFTIVIMILFILSACTPRQTPIDKASAVQTVVAATLSAMPSATSSPAATLTFTPGPTATLTPEPTITSTPAPMTLRVVYSRAGEIWIWNQDGKPLKLSNFGIDIQPRISSDGKIVVFARNNELYAVNADGSNLRKIVSKQYLYPYKPPDYKWIWAEYYDWMLDTHILYFTTMIQQGDNGYSQYQFDLHRVNVDTGEVSVVLSNGRGGIPYFSPNGRTMALARPDSISVANVDGLDWRNALSFEQLPRAGDWVFIPPVVPLLDGSGFRVVIAGYDPLTNPNGLSGFWNIPVVGEPVLLHSFLLTVLPYKTLSPSGNSILYSKTDTNGARSFCFYQHTVGQEYCIPKADEGIFADALAPDDSKYIYKALNGHATEDNYVYETTYHIWSVAGPNNAPVQIDNYVWLTWVNPQQYLYIDEGWDLRLATVGGSNISIHSGVKNPYSQDGFLPFDFSTR